MPPTDELPGNLGARPSGVEVEEQKKDEERAQAERDQLAAQNDANTGSTSLLDAGAGDRGDPSSVKDALDTSGNSDEVNAIVNPPGRAGLPNNVGREPLSTPGSSQTDVSLAAQLSAEDAAAAQASAKGSTVPAIADAGEGPPDDGVTKAPPAPPSRDIIGAEAIIDATGDVDPADDADDGKIDLANVKAFGEQILRDVAATVQGMKLSAEEAARARRAANVLAFCTISSIGATDEARAHLAERAQGATVTLLNQLVGKNVEIRKAAADTLRRTVQGIIRKAFELFAFATAAI